MDIEQVTEVIPTLLNRDDVKPTNDFSDKGEILVTTRLGAEIGNVPRGDEKLSPPSTDPPPKDVATFPTNEQWLHEPERKQKLARAVKWLRENPPRETDLDELVASTMQGALLISERLGSFARIAAVHP